MALTAHSWMPRSPPQLLKSILQKPQQSHSQGGGNTIYSSKNKIKKGN